MKGGVLTHRERSVVGGRVRRACLHRGLRILMTIGSAHAVVLNLWHPPTCLPACAFSWQPAHGHAANNLSRVASDASVDTDDHWASLAPVDVRAGVSPWDYGWHVRTAWTRVLVYITIHGSSCSLAP